jgi:hypothetical protein
MSSLYEHTYDNTFNNDSLNMYFLHSPLEIQYSPPLEIQYSPPLEIQYEPPLEIQYEPPLEIQYEPPLEVPSSAKLKTPGGLKFDTTTLSLPKVSVQHAPPLNHSNKLSIKTKKPFRKRAPKKFVPEYMKDAKYYEHRAKNTAIARKSREKARKNKIKIEKIEKKTLDELNAENKRLKESKIKLTNCLLGLKIKFLQKQISH